MSTFRILASAILLQISFLMASPPEEPKELILSSNDLTVAADEFDEWLDDMRLELIDTMLSNCIDDIVERLKISGGINRHFQVKLLTISEPNAFSLANGSIYISAGLFHNIASEAQLAFLLSHEMSHVILCHHMQRRYELHVKSRTIMQNQLASSIVLGIRIGNTYNMLQRAMSGFSKKQEYEADSLAILTVKTAGYNAMQSVELFASIKDRFKKEGIEYDTLYSTHPQLLDRKAACVRILERVFIQKDSTDYNFIETAGKELYKKVVLSATLKGCSLCIRDRKIETALEMANSIIKSDPQIAEAHILKAKAHFEKGEPKDLGSAIIHYQKALAIDNTLFTAYRDIAYTFLKKGDTKNAYHYFQQYINANPTAIDSSYIQHYMERCHD